MYAAAGGHRDVVELLVEKGADVTATAGVSVMLGSYNVTRHMYPAESSPSGWKYCGDDGG